MKEMAGPERVNPAARTFAQGFRALAYVEGQNLHLEHSRGRLVPSLDNQVGDAALLFLRPARALAIL